MNKSLQNELLKQFQIYIGKIDGRKATHWKIKLIDNQIKVSCINGTRHWIPNPPTSIGITALWNKNYPQNRIKEVKRYCLDFDDRATEIFWLLELL